jgi:hypothetical protein
MHDNNSKIFQHAFKLKSIDIKISTYLLLTLSNMLALDFDLRKNNSNLSDYISSCCLNLSSYLENRSFFTQSFDDAFLLFTVAIKLNNQRASQDLKTTQNLSTAHHKAELKILNNSNISNLSKDEKDLISNILFQLESTDPQARLNNLINETDKHKTPPFINQTKKQTVANRLLNLLKIQQKYGKIKNSNFLVK